MRWKTCSVCEHDQLAAIAAIDAAPKGAARLAIVGRTRTSHSGARSHAVKTEW